MSTLRSVLADADRRRVAVGHFNVSEIAGVRAVVEAARAVGLPVVIGASESERRFFGIRQLAATVRSLREETGHPIFLDADHTHSIAAAEEAARAGFDQVVFDASGKPLEENVRETRRAIEAVRAIAPDMVVEGEIGWIGSGSELRDARPEGTGALTTPEEARQYVEATGVDVLAPAVGTMHGMLRSMVRGEAEKRLDVGCIAAIKAAVRIPITLHGASGTNADDLRRAIAAGITLIHVNTELRLAWRHGLERALAAEPDQIAPYTLLAPALAAMREVAQARLALFAGH